MKKSYSFGIICAILIPALTLLTTSGCTSEGKPTPQGELLTIEQIKSLSENQSMNGKLVTIEGYASLCGMFAGGSTIITIGQKNDMKIYPDGFCEGEPYVTAKIFFARNGFKLMGEKERNHVVYQDDLSLEGMKFITDDYQEVPNKKLKFSGALIYSGNTFYLDNITIHQ